jgi:hypothetical protein
MVRRSMTVGQQLDRPPSSVPGPMWLGIPVYEAFSALAG